MSDRGSIVIGWLTKLVVLFAVLGILALDGFKVVVANFGASDDAGVAAGAAADTYAATKDVRAAYSAAVQAVADKDDVVETKTFTVDSTGGVTLTVDRSPATLWMHRVGPLRKWTVVRQSGTGRPPQ